MGGFTTVWTLSPFGSSSKAFDALSQVMYFSNVLLRKRIAWLTIWSSSDILTVEALSVVDSYLYLTAVPCIFEGKHLDLGQAADSPRRIPHCGENTISLEKRTSSIYNLFVKIKDSLGLPYQITIYYQLRSTAINACDYIGILTY